MSERIPPQNQPEETTQLKWIPNVYTRFVLDWVHADFGTPVTVNGVAEDYEDAIMFRAQIDF